jgi:hypothetical protein
MWLDLLNRFLFMRFRLMMRFLGFLAQYDAQEPWPQPVSPQYVLHVRHEQRAQFSSLISLALLVFVP